jgi:hypothetical protein
MGKHIDGAWSPVIGPPAYPLRRGASACLQWLGQVLDRRATRLLPVVAVSQHRVPELEFYAEASAPEGALYVDGQLIGHLRGVRRL